VIAALLSSASAIKLNDNHTLVQASKAHEIQQKAQNAMQIKIKDATDQQLVGMVQKTIADSKAGKLVAVQGEDPLVKDGEMKAVEAALAKRIIDNLGVWPYPYPWPYDIYTRSILLRAYNDAILKYELDNAIAGLVAPSIADVLKIINAANDKSAGASSSNSTAPATPAAPAAPAASSFVQTEGVPVLVNPVLMKNEMADVDLGQRDIIIEGVNGFDYVQENDNVDAPNDSVTLQVNGIPVLVNPESMVKHNEVGGVPLFSEQTTPFVVGFDTLTLVQTKAIEPSDEVVL